MAKKHGSKNLWKRIKREGQTDNPYGMQTPKIISYKPSHR
jgi:hypothetical protein